VPLWNPNVHYIVHVVVVAAAVIVPYLQEYAEVNLELSMSIYIPTTASAVDGIYIGDAEVNFKWRASYNKGC
jgi:hypothetical protein